MKRCDDSLELSLKKFALIGRSLLLIIYLNLIAKCQILFFGNGTSSILKFQC